MSLFDGSFEPIMATGGYDPMAIPADRVARILGLRANVRSVADIAEAVESGLPKHSLERVVERAGIEGPARVKLMHRVVPAATYKRRHRLKLVEGESTERLARVIALAEMLWDDEAEAKRFLATPHPGARPQEAHRSRAHRARRAPGRGHRHARALRPPRLS